MRRRERKPETDATRPEASKKSNVQYKLTNKTLGLDDPSRTQKPVKSYGVSGSKDGAACELRLGFQSQTSLQGAGDVFLPMPSCLGSIWNYLVNC